MKPTAQPLDLPFTIEHPRGQLLAPLREATTRAETAARAALAQLCAVDGCDIGPFQDGVQCCLDGGAGDQHAFYFALSARHIVRLASRRDEKSGYDTWPQRDLDQLIAANEALAATLHALHLARRAQRTAEQQEIADLTQRRTA